MKNGKQKTVRRFSSNRLLSLTERVIRDIEENKLTRNKLSPEDYARMLRLMDVVKDALKS